ncbi:MAG: metallophosphoesterase [Brevinematales bacterium]|nr:metallophosphoesterase [Brevinematales bacterium]
MIKLTFNLSNHKISQSLIFAVVTAIISTNTSMGLRILHLTDLHIDNINLFAKNYSRNIKMLQKNINILSPNVVIVSGDIVEFGEGIFAKANYEILNNLFYYSNGNFYFDKDLKIPLYFVPGNHEYETMLKLSSTDIPNYRKFIGSNFVNYYIDIQDVRLIFLDTGYDYYFSLFSHNSILPDPESVGLFQNQLDFLERALKTSSNINIIITHHPYLNPQNGIQEGVFKFGRDEFQRLMHTYNVSLILSGHTHKNRVFDSKTNLVTSFPLIAKERETYHIQTGSIGKDGYYRMIEIKNKTVIIYDSENCEDYLTIQEEKIPFAAEAE